MRFIGAYIHTYTIICTRGIWLLPSMHEVFLLMGEPVCSTELIGRHNSSTGAELTQSEGGEEQGGGSGRAWQHDMPIKVEDSICSEPLLKVDAHSADTRDCTDLNL